MAVVPAATDPICGIAPLTQSIASISVVFPAPPYERRAILRIASGLDSFMDYAPDKYSEPYDAAHSRRALRVCQRGEKNRLLRTLYKSFTNPLRVRVTLAHGVDSAPYRI